jgi:hypothetical protein
MDNKKRIAETRELKAQRQATRSNIGLSQPSTSRFGTKTKLLAAVVTVTLLILVFANINTTTIVKTAKDTLTVPSASAEEIVRDSYERAGWKPDTFVVGGEVNTSIVQPKAGKGSYCKDGIKTPNEQIIFLKSGSKEARSAIADLRQRTGNDEKSICDPVRWVAVQPKGPFTYENNYSYVNGKKVWSGRKAGQAGEIVLNYVSQTTATTTVKVIAFRGPCDNTQGSIPIQTTTTVITTSLTIKEVVVPTTKPAVTIVPQHYSGGGHGGGGTNTPPVVSKDPASSVLVNPAVSSYKKEDVVNEPKKTISNDNGAVVSNGYQSNPKADEAVAADNATTTASQEHAAAVTQAATSGSTGTNTDQSKTQATTPDANW